MALIANTPERYSLSTVLIHWLVALVIVGLFAVGWWMVELDYYSEWYRVAPEYHKGVGVMLVLVMLLRLAIRLTSPRPTPEPGRRWEHRVAHGVHLALYGLIFLTCVCGYLISTADGRALGVFNWFELPATITSIPEQEELMGDIHVVLGIVILSLAALHAAAALKHHFIDHDRTLVRMFGKAGGNPKVPGRS